MFSYLCSLNNSLFNMSCSLPALTAEDAAPLVGSVFDRDQCLIVPVSLPVSVSVRCFYGFSYETSVYPWQALYNSLREGSLTVV